MASYLLDFWNFCSESWYIPQPLTFRKGFKAAKLLFKYRNKHRNYIWENCIEDAYCLAFYLAPWDQYYAKRYWFQKPNWYQTIFFYLNLIFVLLFGSKSIRLVTWVQLKDLQMDKLAGLIDVKDCLTHDFNKDHPFIKGVK